MDPNFFQAICTIFMGLFAWLGRRDALRNEARTNGLEHQNRDQQAKIDTLEAATKKCQSEHAHKDELLESERDRNHRLEVAVARLEVMLGLKDGSAEKTPLKEEPRK